MSLIECLENLTRKGFDKSTNKHVFAFSSLDAALFFCGMIKDQVDKFAEVYECNKEHCVTYKKRI